MRRTAVVVTIATTMASITAVSTVAAVLTGRARLEFFILLLDVGNEVLTEFLGLVNHPIIGATMNLLEKLRIGKLKLIRDVKVHVLVAFPVSCGL